MITTKHHYIEPDGTPWTVFVEGEQPDRYLHPERFVFSAQAHMDAGMPQYTAHDHNTPQAALCDVIGQIFEASQEIDADAFND